MEQSPHRTAPGLLNPGLIALLDARAQAVVHRADETSRRAAAGHIVDAFGCLVRGGTHPTVERGVVTMRRMEESGTARSLAHPDLLVAPATAVGLDAMACHADEFDSVHPGSGTVPAGVVVPTALTLGSWLHSSGETVIQAVLAGTEVIVEAALAKGGHRLYERSWWPTLVFGALGSAAASAHLLGLDDVARQHALSLAACLAGGLLTEDVFLDNHYWNYGEVAARGVRAAFLAEAGMQGSATLLNGPFDRAFHTTTHITSATQPRISECVYKTYPCAMSLQAVAQGVEELARGTDASTISQVTVALPDSLAAFVSNESRPEGQAEAATSLPFVVAAALSGHARSVDHYREHTIDPTNSPQVTLDTDDELATSSHELPIRLAVTTADGPQQDVHKTFRSRRTASRAKYQANVSSRSVASPGFEDLLNIARVTNVATLLSGGAS